MNTSGSTPYNITRVIRKRTVAQMKEQNKIPEREVREKETDNLSDAVFGTLVIRMLTEMIEYDHKIKEEVKAIES